MSGAITAMNRGRIRIMTIAGGIRIVTIIAGMRIIGAMVGTIMLKNTPTDIGMIAAARERRAL
jgi:hypothetical protein